MVEKAHLSIIEHALDSQQREFYSMDERTITAKIAIMRDDPVTRRPTEDSGVVFRAEIDPNLKNDLIIQSRARDLRAFYGQQVASQTPMGIAYSRCYDLRLAQRQLQVILGRKP